MRQCTALCAIALCAALNAGAAFAGDADKSPAGPTFGSRTDKPDGSSALTVGRRLPTSWETKVGADVRLLAREYTTASIETLARALTEAPEWSARVNAAKILLKRGWGAPRQVIDAVVHPGVVHEPGVPE